MQWGQILLLSVSKYTNSQKVYKCKNCAPLWRSVLWATVVWYASDHWVCCIFKCPFLIRFSCVFFYTWNLGWGGFSYHAYNWFAFSPCLIRDDGLYLMSQLSTGQKSQTFFNSTLICSFESKVTVLLHFM